jgi:hypothetical protein
MSGTAADGDADGEEPVGPYIVVVPEGPDPEGPDAEGVVLLLL